VSSIYKKGRDGYYYYQTYIYNSETKKKNKRIFHALGTKDYNEAKKKQDIFDQKYDYQKSSNSIIFKIKSAPSLKVVLIIIVLTLFSSELFYSTFISKKKIDNDIILSTDKAIQKDEIISKSFDSSITIKEEISVSYSNFMESEMTENIDTQNVNDVSFANHRIERVEKIAGAFNQIKIYAITDIESDSLGLKLLCKKILQGYDDFDSIIICLYKDNTAGNNLAKGNNELVSLIEQKEAWLSMYTYNSVEGEYFDHNPTSYLHLY